MNASPSSMLWRLRSLEPYPLPCLAHPLSSDFHRSYPSEHCRSTDPFRFAAAPPPSWGERRRNGTSISRFFSHLRRACKEGETIFWNDLFSIFAKIGVLNTDVLHRTANDASREGSRLPFQGLQAEMFVWPPKSHFGEGSPKERQAR